MAPDRTARWLPRHTGSNATGAPIHPTSSPPSRPSRRPAMFRVPVRTILLATAVAMALLVPTTQVAAAYLVDCDSGLTIKAALSSLSGAPNAVIIGRGTCTENFQITQDNVTIKTDGVHPLHIVAADNGQSAIAVTGSYGVVLDGVFAGGLTVNG